MSEKNADLVAPEGNPEADNPIDAFTTEEHLKMIKLIPNIARYLVNCFDESEQDVVVHIEIAAVQVGTTQAYRKSVIVPIEIIKVFEEVEGFLPSSETIRETVKEAKSLGRPITRAEMSEAMQLDENGKRKGFRKIVQATPQDKRLIL